MAEKPPSSKAKPSFADLLKKVPVSSAPKPVPSEVKTPAPPKAPAVAATKSLATAPVLQEIEAASKRVNELATELSKRILAFEDWLNELPGKVSTTLWVSANDPFDQYEFGIHLGRSGKRWSLSWATQQPGMPDELVDWKPLAEASVETKLHAASFFPDLLKKIVEEQETLAKTLNEAHLKFDAFAAEIGLLQNDRGAL